MHDWGPYFRWENLFKVLKGGNVVLLKILKRGHICVCLCAKVLDEVKSHSPPIYLLLFVLVIESISGAKVLQSAPTLSSLCRS